MTNNPLVSIIVPNYNYARYMDERMDSILRQTYTNYEIIILDDASTDNSREIIEKFRKEPHVTNIVYNEKNSGSAFRQWSKGFTYASGELIWIAEADDKCEPDFLEKLTNTFRKDKNLVLAFSRTVAFTDNGLGHMFWQGYKLPEIFHIDGISFDAKFMSNGSFLGNASSAIFKRSALNNISEDFINYKSNGDLLFWIQVAKQGNVSVVNQPLNYCRRHGDNVTEKSMMSPLGGTIIESYKIKRYLYKEHIIGYWKFQEVCANYLFYHVLNNRYISTEKRQEFLDMWEYNWIKKIYVLFLRVKITFKKLINFVHSATVLGL